LALRADLTAWSTRGGFIGRLAGWLTFGARDISPAALATDRRRLRLLGVLGIPLAIAFHGGVGALFGVIGARPYWNTSLLPILFLVSALASGGALLTFVVAYFWPTQRSQHYRDMVLLLGRMTLGLLAFDLLLEWAEVSINLYGSLPAHTDAYRAMMFGPFWWVFWIGHLLLGTIVPIALLLLFPRSPRIVGAAGGLIAALFITVRANIILPGLVIPELHGLERAYTDLRLNFNYAPSPLEYQVAIFVAAFGIAAFFLGYWLLPLVDRGGPALTYPQSAQPALDEPVGEMAAPAAASLGRAMKGESR
jgi:molybdopterin-containing oxidoreductase family membrane subunit